MVDRPSSVRIFRKSSFKKSDFDSIDPEALNVIETADEHQILVLTMVGDSEVKIAKAELFDESVLERILKSFEQFYSFVGKPCFCRNTPESVGKPI